MPSGGRAACWLVVTRDDRFAFVSNTLSDTVPDAGSGVNAVTRYSVSHDGALTYLGQASTEPPTGGPTFPGDMALSCGQPLPVPDQPDHHGGNTSHIDAYRVDRGGSLKLIQSTTPDLPLGISGAAAF